MNFENYNKIYQEVLDNNEGVSANYLMNKYEISQEVELINILNQIKKNEYISSDNTIINKLLKELDENDDLLDINEIIEIKEKIIDINFSHTVEPTKTEYDNINLSSNETTKSNDNLESNVEQSKNKTALAFDFNTFITKKNLTYAGVATIALFLSTAFLFNSKQEDTFTIEKISQIEKEKINSTDQKVALLTKEVDVIVTNSGNEEEIIQQEPEQTLTITDNEVKNTPNEEPTAREIIDQQESQPSATQNNNLQTKLSSLDEIENYVKDMHFDNGSLYFNNTAYKENDKLFGFKIYKLTSMYVKFEDETNQIRKRYIFNN